MQGHITKRGDTYYVVVYLGRGPDGRKKYKWFRAGKRKKDAEAELARIVHEIHTGTYVDAGKMTVTGLLERWLADYAKHNVARRTYERYEEIVRKHWIPAIGHIELNKLQPIHIQEQYTRWTEGGRLDGRGGGLSPKTVVQHHRVLRKALQWALKMQLIARNPADAAQPPRPARREMRALDAHQTVRLLQACEGTPLYIPVLLAVTCGMRRGEILGLRWKDVDLERGVLTVRQALEETRDGLRFKGPKTAAGNRSIALPALAVQALRRHRVQQAKERLLMGPAYEDHDLVCARPDGKPLRPDYLSQALPRVAQQAGLPRIRFHDLRHSHATHLLQAGVHPKVVAERLGHATVQVTLDIYSHVLPTLQQDAAQRLDATLAAAAKALPPGGLERD